METLAINLRTLSDEQHNFSQIKKNTGCSNTVEIPLLRFWDNVKKGGELMSVDMLLLDEKSTQIKNHYGQPPHHVLTSSQ
ncbi:hypothetical protein DY000_02008788 [Brassica cretica]|uniref:Uncharacterized protein n=1 Tax=Brassica cretica TaxID=69181 RepID=A0ABQ7BVX2_BRACR|nr:hypothetical protein DY000_02008788 [Brassica cretica]